MMRLPILALGLIAVGQPDAGSASPPPSYIAGTSTAGETEPEFLARLGTFFHKLSSGRADITRQRLNVIYSSPSRMPGDQPFPFPASEARFSCIDTNGDGRVTEKEYLIFGSKVFRSAAHGGLLDLSTEQGATAYRHAANPEYCRLHLK